MENIQDREIVFCNLQVIYKGKLKKLNSVVYKHTDGNYRNIRELKKIGINEPVKVSKLEIIERLGFERKNNTFTEVKKSDESRNKTTGAYE